MQFSFSDAPIPNFLKIYKPCHFLLFQKIDDWKEIFRFAGWGKNIQNEVIGVESILNPEYSQCKDVERFS